MELKGDGLEEGNRLPTVNESVVVGERQVHHGPRHHLALSKQARLGTVTRNKVLLTVRTRSCVGVWVAKARREHRHRYKQRTFVRSKKTVVCVEKAGHVYLYRYMQRDFVLSKGVSGCVGVRGESTT